MSSSNSTNSIPFLDLVTPHVELEQELTAYFTRLCTLPASSAVLWWKNSRRHLPPSVARAIRSRSAAVPMHCALPSWRAGVKAGDVVVTVPNTFIATTEAISQAGALPEFVDIDERTYNMDPEKLREYLEQQCTSDKSGKLISRRSGRPVTAVVPVHLYGQMADMDAILELADALRLDCD